MHRYILLLLLLISLSFRAQTNRFIYEFNSRADSLNPAKSMEYMVLDIDSEYAKFYPYSFLETDSLNTQNPKEHLSMRLPDGKQLMLKRKIESASNTNYVFAGGNYFSYKTTDLPDWRLLEEVKEENGFTLQKAIASFGGRKWEAWFAPSINIKEGPFKFIGLPGLVFEVRDDHDNFHFKLVKNIHLAETFDSSLILETNFGKAAIPVSLKQYQKTLINAYHNLYQNFKEQKEGSWYINTNDGKRIDKVSELNQLIREEQIRIKRNYNPIELDKAVEYK